MTPGEILHLLMVLAGWRRVTVVESICGARIEYRHPIWGAWRVA